MKKMILKPLSAILIAVLFTGCAAFHKGYMSNSAALGSANFSYVKQNIKGKAKATYFIGIGGLGKETLVGAAKKEMLAANPLQSNQTFANVTVNFKSAYFLGPIIHTVECTVTADVVEFK